MDQRYASFDEYGFRHFPVHLARTSRFEKLREMLFDFEWMQSKLDATEIAALLTDYELSPSDHALHLVQSALRLSANILSGEKSQLAPQLTGRLLLFEESEIKTLLEYIRGTKKNPWLRPLTLSFTPPGGPLVRTLAGHTGAVRAVAITPDSSRVISGSFDNTLKIWGLEHGIELATLQGHTDAVNAVAITSDGRRIVSGSKDKTLKVWDLERGTELATLQGHTSSINAVAVTPDGRRAISGSGDKTLKIWDLERGTEIATLQGHLSAVMAVAVTPDGRRAISGADAGSITVWDLEHAVEINKLQSQKSQGQKFTIYALAVTPDGCHVISAPGAGSLVVWDLERGVETKKLGQHLQGAIAIAVTPDGRKAISGGGDKTLRIWNISPESLSNGIQGNAGIASLQGHTKVVTAVAITPDGRWAVSGSFDNMLKVWDISKEVKPSNPKGISSTIPTPNRLDNRSGEAQADLVDKASDVGLERSSDLTKLHGHSRGPLGVAVLPNSHRAVSRAEDGTLMVWDLERSTELVTMKGTFKFMAITPDSLRAITGSDDYTLKVWDLEHGSELFTLKGHTSHVLTVAITSDGRRAISTSDDKTLKVWDLQHGAELATLHGHTNFVEAVAVMPDGRRAVSRSGEGTLKVWDLEFGTELTTMESTIKKNISIIAPPRTNMHATRAVAVTPDGRRAVLGSWDGMLKVWDLEQGVETITLHSHTKFVNKVMVTSDSCRAISVSGGVLQVWDLEHGAELFTLRTHATAMAVTPDGHCAVLGSDVENMLQVWDLERGTEIASYIMEKSTAYLRKFNTLAITPDGRRAVSGSYYGRISVWDLEFGTELATLGSHAAPATAVAVTPDCRCAISGSPDGTLKLWDLERGIQLTTLQCHTDVILSLSVTPDGQHAVTGSQDGTIKMWDLKRGTELATLQGHKDADRAVLVTPDSRRVVSRSRDTFKIWDISDFLIASPMGGTDLIKIKSYTIPSVAPQTDLTKLNTVVVTPDGRRAVSGSDDHMLKVWDLESGTELATLYGHTDTVHVMVVTPDGHRVISGSDDHTLKVWDLESGIELATLQDHKGPINAAVVTSDGSRAISGSKDRTLKVWDLTGYKLLATFSGDDVINDCAVVVDGSKIFAGEVSGRVYFLHLENVVPAASVVTAWDSNRVLAFGCPHCRTWSEILQPALGSEISCPNCGKPVKLNPFTIEGDWKLIAKAW
jgi:WD40 repeat protein